MSEIPGPPLEENNEMLEPSVEDGKPDVDLVKQEYRRRFMSPIRKGMMLLSEHPDTKQTLDEQGKPIVRTLNLDDVQGRYSIAVRVGPSDWYRKAEQLEHKITVIDFRVDPKLVRPVTVISSYTDGTIGVDYAKGIDDSGRLIDEEGFTIDDYLPLEHDDFSEFDHVEIAEEALDAALADMPRK